MMHILFFNDVDVVLFLSSLMVRYYSTQAATITGLVFAANPSFSFILARKGGGGEGFFTDV